MPRPDGSLYNFEREALKPKPEPKPKPAKVAKPKPGPTHGPDVVTYANGRKAHPLHSSVYKGSNGKAGRPAVIRPTPELIEKVCADIAQGLTIETALILAGLKRDAVDKWRKLNPAVEMEFVKAEAAWEKRIVGNVDRMASSDLKANTFLLERRAAARWAPVGKTELTGKNGGAIQVHSLSAQLLASVGGEMKQAVPA